MKNYYMIVRKKSPALRAMGVFLTFILTLAYAKAGPQEDSIYEAVLKATFIPEKKVEARKLGRLKTPEARVLLLKLLKDPSSWNRSGAVAGLFEFRDTETGQILIDAMIEDHMIDSEISAGFRENIDLYFPVIEKKYYSLAGSTVWRANDHRKKVIALIASSKSRQGQLLLKKIIEDAGSGDREEALQALAVNYPGDNYDYMKARVTESVFRQHVLEYLVQHGRASDLGLFLEVIDRKEKPVYIIIAYKAVEKWGVQELKLNTFIGSLKESDETLTQAGLLTFYGIKSKPVKDELFRLIKKGIYQRTRMLSAKYLADYESADVIPYLIIILKENYSPEERGGIDMFLTGITFGITSLLDDLSEKSRKSDFNENISYIAAKLKKTAGADLGVSYSRWFDWAVYHGYTIEGTNIIQYLFSGYKSKREQAIESAIKLLGYESVFHFYQGRSKFNDEKDLLLFLAGELIRKGFLADETY